MITNERQYKITKSQLRKLEEAIKVFDMQATADRIGSDILARAELSALESEADVLREQIGEYQALRSGAIVTLEASNLEELPKMLIYARIAQRLSQKELADLVGLKEQQIQRYEAEEYAGANLKRLRQVAEALKLKIHETAEINSKPDARKLTKMGMLDWKKFPVEEMYRRGWFEGFSGSIDDAVNGAESLIREFLSQTSKKPTLAAFYKQSVRSGSRLDNYALLAWESRVLSLATKTRLSHRFGERVPDARWISSLIHASMQDDGPRAAMRILEEVGIPLIIEPYLTNTYLDGAALLSGDMPVIGMTLRYDRLDNFWFVLVHELFHVLNHLRKGRLENVFDDLDAEGKNEIEREADALAEEALIPGQLWQTALPRYVQSEQAIKDFAASLGIDSSIVAGRIRYEAKNYRILNELIGQGMVRKWFSDVRFGV